MSVAHAPFVAIPAKSRSHEQKTQWSKIGKCHIRLKRQKHHEIIKSMKKLKSLCMEWNYSCT